MKVLSLLTNALVEADWLAPGEQPDADTAAFLLSKLNDLLDEWAAQRVYVYSTPFTLFNLVPNLSPHTMGPTGTFVVSQRPVRLESASLFLTTSTPGTDVPLRVRDADWWAINRVKGVTTSIPTNVYYDPAFPNGNLYFWPVPNASYQVRLQTWDLISQISNAQSDLSLPAAYRKAITLTLAEELAGPRSSDPKLARSASKARAALKDNNSRAPRIASKDIGMSSGTDANTGFNWQTGDLV